MDIRTHESISVGTSNLSQHLLAEPMKVQVLAIGRGPSAQPKMTPPRHQLRLILERPRPQGRTLDLESFSQDRCEVDRGNDVS